MRESWTGDMAWKEGGKLGEEKVESEVESVDEEKKRGKVKSSYLRRNENNEETSTKASSPQRREQRDGAEPFCAHLGLGSGVLTSILPF